MVLKVAQFLRNLHREEEGFTLIELLIVIAIIAVIAAIAIPMVAGRIDDARESADRANVRTLQGLVDQCYIDFGEYPIEVGDETANGVEDGNWIKYLVDKELLHSEGVKSPYPGDDVGGYKLTVKEGDKPGRLIGEVESSEQDRWKKIEEGGSESPDPDPEV